LKILKGGVSVKKTERHGLSGNGGFSLVELLVAVIILGIIVSPLLHTFVTGAVTASKSRKMGDATLAAQNISEAIEASDLNTDVILNAAPTIFGGTATRTVNDVTSGIYSYDITGLTAGKSMFNAVVELDKNGGTGSPFEDINSRDVVNYSNMDAVFAQTQGTIDDPDVVSMTHFRTHAALDGYAGNPDIKREIDLDIDYGKNDDGTANTNKLTATLNYIYNYTYTATGLDSSGNQVSSIKTWTDKEEYDLFPQGFNIAAGEMPNIYLMYNPDYKNGDDIKINNLKNLSLNVFLVKQKGSNTQVDEGNYKAEIFLTQTATSPKPNATIYSNAARYLYSDTKSSLLGVRFKYKYNPNFYFVLDVTGNLVAQSPKERIYGITIKITDSNGAVLTTLQTAKLA
jgi:prepilin-type N-terminal cleavage/methylation domain-containing protein